MINKTRKIIQAIRDLGVKDIVSNNYLLLDPLPESYHRCPKCGHEPFESFMRGLVVRFDWFGLRKKTCTVICWNCKERVGYEDPQDPELLLRSAIE